LLSAGKGAFTCCDCDLHEEGVPCDKEFARQVLDQMIDAKVAHLRCGKRVVEQRFFACLKPHFLHGLHAPPGAARVTTEESTADCCRVASDATATCASPLVAPSDGSAVTRLAASLDWTAEDEAKKATSGWSLLLYAAAAGDLLAVRETRAHTLGRLAASIGMHARTLSDRMQ
jgi:hypothetical protein